MPKIRQIATSDKDLFRTLKTQLAIVTCEFHITFTLN